MPTTLPAAATRPVSEAGDSCLLIRAVALSSVGTTTASTRATAISQSSADSQIHVSLTFATCWPSCLDAISPKPKTTTSTDT